MKRAALIGIISLTGLFSLWLLLAWLGKTESTYHQPRPGMRFEGKGENDSAPKTTAVYRPRHFTAGEVGHYQVRVEKGFLKMPAGKVTFAAQQIDHNGTTAWQFTLKGGALGGLVQYDARSIVNAQFTHSLEYHTVQKYLASRNVVLQFDPQQQRCLRQLNGNPDGVVDTEPSTFDPLSIIFKDNAERVKGARFGIHYAVRVAVELTKATLLLRIKLQHDIARGQILLHCVIFKRVGELRVHNRAGIVLHQPAERAAFESELPGRCAVVINLLRGKCYLAGRHFKKAFLYAHLIMPHLASGKMAWTIHGGCFGSRVVFALALKPHAGPGLMVSALGLAQPREQQPEAEQTCETNDADERGAFHGVRMPSVVALVNAGQCAGLARGFVRSLAGGRSRSRNYARDRLRTVPAGRPCIR